MGPRSDPFDPRLAFDFPPGAWKLDGRFASGLGVALGIAMYDYLGYDQVCYLGDEVEEPARTLPRAILISIVAVAVIYLDDEPFHPGRPALAAGDRDSARGQRLLAGPVRAGGGRG